MKRQINPENLVRILWVVLTMATEIDQGMTTIGDFKKDKGAFKSLYCILDIKRIISAFKENNKEKINP